jgi:hypothetical protein
VAPGEATLDGEGARLLAAAGAEEVFLEAAEVEPEAGGLALRPAAGVFRGAVPRGTPVTLVARGSFGGTVPIGDPEAAGVALAAELRDLALSAEEAGLLPLGVHLEPGFGEPPPPAELVRAVRTGLGSELLLSISIPRRVLDAGATSDDAFESAAESARAADFVVVDLYGHPARAADDPAAWDPEVLQSDLAKLGELGADFVAGLHVVGNAWHLDSAGERVEGEGTSRADLKALALDPALRLEIDPFASNGRLLYVFQAQAPARVAIAGSTWRLSPGESIRVSRSAPPVARWILDALEESGPDGYTGPLFRRIGAADERLAFQPADIAAALGAETGGPEIGWRIVVESRDSDSVVLQVELENRGTQSTELVTTEGVEQDLRQWTAVADHLAQRKQDHEERIGGQGGPREGTLAYDRQRLVDSIGTATRQAVASFDREREAADLAESARSAVAGTALLEIGGLGIGAAVLATVSAVWIDVTGILAGLTFMTLGLLVLPARRRKANQELESKLAELRRKLVSNLTEQFNREMRRGAQRIEDTIAPFARFVRAEGGRLENQQETLVELEAHMTGLQAQLKNSPDGKTG